MKTLVAAMLVAVALAVPARGMADDTPWAAIKQLFHEPVREMKQIKRKIEAYRPPGQAAAPAKTEETVVKANARVPTPAPAPVPVPVLSQAPRIDPTEESDLKPAPAEPPEPAIAAPATVPQELDEQLDEGLQAAAAPIPRPRPEIAISFAAVETPKPTRLSSAAIGALVAPLPKLVRPPPAAGSTCGATLARLGVEADALAPISEGACGIAKPVAVAALGSGAVDFTTKAIIGCNLAETVATWLSEDVQPMARKTLGGEVVGLRIAASYACRSRNNVQGAKLSEHGKGKAIDISAFNIAGHGWIEVGGRNSLAERRFLKKIRASACGPFKTVLGPGSDVHHSDHFHFDLAQRSNRGKGRGLYCK